MKLFASSDETIWACPAYTSAKARRAEQMFTACQRRLSTKTWLFNTVCTSLREPHFADFHVNSRDGNIRVFRCQRERHQQSGRSSKLTVSANSRELETGCGSYDVFPQNQLVDFASAHNVESMAGQGSAGNVIAALCSFFIPGLGQLLQGRLLMAIIQFCLAAILWFFLLGWIIHLWSILDAALFKPR
jgi:hypothetical protein